MRRRTTWTDVNVGSDIATGDTAVFSLHTGLISKNLDLTLTRMLVIFSVGASTPGVVSGQQELFFGAGVVAQDAFTASAVSDPEQAGDEPTRGWVWKSHLLIRDETLATGYIPPVRLNEDIHSQRKLDEGELFMAIANRPVEGTTFAVRVKGVVRTLWRI